MSTKISELIALAENYDRELPTLRGEGYAKDRPLAAWIDQTLLKPEATPLQVEQLCLEAREYHFAAVCINPVYVPLASQLLSGSGVAVCTVVGFPLGATLTRAKVEETRLCIQEGANEIDMVMAIGLLKGGQYEAAFADIQAVTAAAHQGGALVKVIIETALLNRREKILACLMTQEAGAEFVKTSTGFAASGATVEDVDLMRRVVGPSRQMGVKAAGGVRSLADALAMLKVGANRLGTSAGVKIIQESLSGEKPA